MPCINGASCLWISAKWRAELVIFTYVDQELVGGVVARNRSGSCRDRTVRCTWER